MPITVTFDLAADTGANDRNRIRIAFRRFGWETIGGTAYRYPPLDPEGNEGLNAEDWFNHVIPALMYMRSLIVRRGIQVNNFTIDAFSSTGARAGLGPEIQGSADIDFAPLGGGGAGILSLGRLREWLDACANAT